MKCCCAKRCRRTHEEDDEVNIFVKQKDDELNPIVKQDVWISPHGRKYHNHRACSGLGLAKELSKIMEQDAIKRGFMPCKKCDEVKDIVEQEVWISKNGRKYHSHVTCTGLNHAKELSKVLEKEAIKQGNTQCKKCL